MHLAVGDQGWWMQFPRAFQCDPVTCAAIVFDASGFGGSRWVDAAQVADAEVIIPTTGPLPAEVVAAALKLQLILQPAAGTCHCWLRLLACTSYILLFWSE